jgi:hypothetical protein
VASREAFQATIARLPSSLFCHRDMLGVVQLHADANYDRANTPS